MKRDVRSPTGLSYQDMLTLSEENCPDNGTHDGTDIFWAMIETRQN